MFGKVACVAVVLLFGAACVSPVYSATGVDQLLPVASGEGLVGTWLDPEAEALMVVAPRFEGDQPLPGKFAVALAADNGDAKSHKPPQFSHYAFEAVTLTAGDAMIAQLQAPGPGVAAMEPIYPWSVPPFGFLKVEVRGKRLRAWQILPETFAKAMEAGDRTGVAPVLFGPLQTLDKQPQPVMLTGSSKAIADWLVAHAEDDAVWSEQPVEFERVGKAD